MASCTYIDGIGSSQAIDTAGEIVDLKGLDCSSLLGAAMNWEHKSDIPAQIVGKIVEFKKIFSEKDCDTDRQKYYWNKVQMPFLYCLGRLFDDKKDSSKEAAALFLDDAENPNEPKMVGFSIEGAKVHKDGMTITRSIARKLTLTNLPANKTCVAEMLPSAAPTPNDDIDSIFKTEPTEIEFFKPNSKYLEFLEKKEKEMNKDVGSGGGAFIGSQLAMTEDLEKSATSWSKEKVSTDAVHFHHPEHGTVSVHKQPGGEFHVKHNGALAGLGGVKGSFASAGEAGKHAKNYMSSVSGKKTLPPRMHNRPSPSMIGKNESLNKALEAGSGMSAPSQLTGGAALARSGHPFGNFNPKKKAPKEDSTTSSYSRVSMISTSMGGTGAGMSGTFGRAEKSEKSKWLKRAEEEYKAWGKREQFEQFMKSRLPHLTKGEIKAIGQTLALQKSMKLEKALSRINPAYEEETTQHSSVRKTTDIMMASGTEKVKDK